MIHTYGEIAAQRPTGRARYRKGWFGRKVRQIEIESPWPRYPAPPRPGADVWERGGYTFWRDERLTDTVFDADSA